MREFNLDLLIGKEVIVNCKTKNEEVEFLNYLDKNGFRWRNGCAVFESNEYRFEEYLQNTCFALYNSKSLAYSDLDFYTRNRYKILSLEDLVIKPKNNFKEYGFEADFEGEILGVRHGYMLCWVREPNGKIFHGMWDENGYNKCSSVGNAIYDTIKPIKKEWFENPDNFPCIVISLKTNKPHIAYNYNHLEEKIKQETFSANPDKFRPATKEEVLSLLIKED